MIIGWDKVLLWFEGRSSFHDAEILELHSDRAGTSYIRLHWWVMRAELDARGYYILDKHAAVTLYLRGVYELDLKDFNHQNVIFGLEVQTAEHGVRLVLDGCYGLSGSFAAEEVMAEVTPGEPQPAASPPSPDRN